MYQFIGNGRGVENLKLDLKPALEHISLYEGLVGGLVVGGG